MSDNKKGLILKVASSLFMGTNGTSFMLKKKGFKRAATSGTLAGQSQFHSKSISRSTNCSIFIYLFIQFYQELVLSFPNELDFSFRLYMAIFCVCLKLKNFGSLCIILCLGWNFLMVTDSD